MPRKEANLIDDTPAPTEDENAAYELVTTAPDDWEFDVVVDQSPTQVEFDAEGDTFIGMFRERRTINPDKGGDPFDLLIFQGRDGDPYSLSPSYKLDQAFRDGIFVAGEWYRVVLVALIDTGRKDNPLKDYRVDRKRNH